MITSVCPLPQDISAQEVLSSLFQADETVCLRVFEDRDEGIFPGAKYPVLCGSFASMEQTLRNHNALNRGVFFVVNYGGDSDDRITRVNAQFTEMDHDSFDDQWRKIAAFPLPPSMVIRTRKSLHVYWFIRDGEVSRFRTVQKQLVRQFSGDPACVNESRCMRLPGFNHCKQDPVRVTVLLFHPERRYTQQQLADHLPAVEEAPPERKKGNEPGLDIVVEGCDFIRHCVDDAATLPEHDWYAMICNLAVFEGGVEMIHRISAPYPGYSEAETQKKINHFLSSGTSPITCRTIAEKGFRCPKMASGECTCRAPAALSFQPLGIDGLRRVISSLPITGDDTKDLKSVTDFVRRYLFNQEPAIAEGIITTELRDRYHLKSGIVRTLCQAFRQAEKDYQRGLSVRQRRVEDSLPPWYEPTENGGLRFMPGILADHLAEERKVIFAAQEFYGYDSGVYRPLDEKQAEKIVRDSMLPRETKMSQITDAARQWQLIILRGIHELNANPYIINVRNGLYNVLEGTLTPHSPDFLSTMQLSVRYDPDAECPRFLQYLQEVVETGQIPLIQEMLGYFLIPVTRAQKCFVIVGEGGSGKSQLLLVLNDILLGRENVSNVSWQALNERFKPAELFGKLANIFADLPTKNIDDNGIFKALVGEDFLTVEKKNKDPFSFQSTARLLFSCNAIPRNYGDRSEGFYRRLIIIRFNHAVPEEKRDAYLQDKFRKEADGIFLFALEGLKRLLRNHFHFSETEANKAELQQYREESDSVLSFIRDCCLLGDPNAEVGSTELFNAYKAYCEECGMKPYAQRNFTMQLQASHPEVEKAKDPLGNRRILRGIRLAEAQI